MQIPGFKIQRTIGRGGMATAYLAEQESLQRQVVLKAIDSTLGKTEDFVERFMNEGRIVASLRHPNIITVYDIGITDDIAWLAMEYVDGGDLKSRTGKPMAPLEALDIIEKIGGALAYAHENGIIHRDVKPANILFRSDHTPLLGDFGIAKQISADSELTSTGTILGSPFYMSPEQAEGMKVDGRTDIYSLGIIFYELLTGERPYLGDSAIKVIMQHIQAPLPTLPDKYAQFQPLLASMLDKNREKRVASARELVLAVQRQRAEVAAGSEPRGHEATPNAPALQLGKSARHPRRTLLVVSVVIVLLALTGVAGLEAYTRSLRPTLVRHAAPAAETIEAPDRVAAAHARVIEESRSAAGTRALGATVTRDQATKAILWLAANALREGRLTRPPADNALYFYSRLLALDPNNQDARAGLVHIAERFVILAEKDYSRGDYGKALANIALGLQVDPGNKQLLNLQSFIDNRKEGFVDKLLALFSRSN